MLCGGNDAPAGWVNGPVTLHLDATDGGSGVASTYYRIGADVATYTGSVPVSAGGTTDVGNWSGGSVGNASTPATATIRIDYTAPGVTDDAPAGWVNGPVTVNITATDPGSGIESVLYSTDGSEPSLPVVDGSVSISDEGTTTLRYKAIDRVGKSSSIGVAVITIDDSSPVSSDDAPESWTASAVDVALSSSDAFSGVADIIYTLAGA